MQDIKIIFVPKKEMRTEHKKAVIDLRKECFNDLDNKELKEHFAPANRSRFGRIFVYYNGKIIAATGLFKRNIKFDSKKVLLGGMGGFCTLKQYRRRGLATKLVQYGLRIIKDLKCDIACLSVDRQKGIYGLYEKAGFRFLNRPSTFEDANGKIISDDSTMIHPLNNHLLYERIMNSQITFHYGKGYW